MKNTILMTACLALAIFLIGCAGEDAQVVSEPEPPTKEEIIETGKYLVGIMGCADCHTPKKMTEQGPVPDMDRWLMGHPADEPLPEIYADAVGPGKWALFNGGLTAAVGPWGVTFSANLTPHESGIGTWTYEQFKKAMTEGKLKGLDNSRPIMPPMPWQNFQNVKEEDLTAIFEYLMSIKPIENVVPEYIPPTAM